MPVYLTTQTVPNYGDKLAGIYRTAAERDVAAAADSNLVALADSVKFGDIPRGADPNGDWWVRDAPAVVAVNASTRIQYAGSGLGFNLTWATGETGKDGNEWEVRTTSQANPQFVSNQKQMYLPRPSGTGAAYKAILEAISGARSLTVEYLLGTSDTTDFSALSNTGTWRPQPDPNPLAWPTFAGGKNALAIRKAVFPDTTPDATYLKAQRYKECVNAMGIFERGFGAERSWALIDWFRNLGTAAPTLEAGVEVLDHGLNVSAARTLGLWWWKVSMLHQYWNHGDAPSGYRDGALANEGTGDDPRIWYKNHKMTVTQEDLDDHTNDAQRYAEFTSTSAPWIFSFEGRLPYLTAALQGGTGFGHASGTLGSPVASADFLGFIA